MGRERASETEGASEVLRSLAAEVCLVSEIKIKVNIPKKLPIAVIDGNGFPLFKRRVWRCGGSDSTERAQRAWVICITQCGRVLRAQPAVAGRWSEVVSFTGAEGALAHA